MDSSNEISLKLKIEYEDYKRFVKKTSKVNNKNSKIITALIFVALVFIDSWKYINTSKFLIRVIVNATFLLILFGFFLFIYSIGDFRKIKKSYLNNKIIQYENTYLISSCGIRYKSEVEEGILNWEDVFRILEDKTAFYVYISPDSAHIILKRAFNSNGELLMFIDILKNNIGKNKLKLINN